MRLRPTNFPLFAAGAVAAGLTLGWLSATVQDRYDEAAKNRAAGVAETTTIS